GQLRTRVPEQLGRDGFAQGVRREHTRVCRSGRDHDHAAADGLRSEKAIQARHRGSAAAPGMSEVRLRKFWQALRECRSSVIPARLRRALRAWRAWNPISLVFANQMVLVRV